MKKILSLTLTLIMLAMLFSACESKASKHPTAGDFFSNYTEDPSWVYRDATVIPALTDKYGANSQGSSDVLRVFSKEANGKTDVIIYDLEKNKNVHQFTVDNDDLYTVELMTFNGNPFFSVIHGIARTDGMDFSTTLYTRNGNAVATAKGIHVFNDFYFYNGRYDGSIDTVYDLVRFDKTIFRVAEDGTTTVLKEKNPFTLDLPNVHFYNGTHYIYTTGNGFVVYDNSLEPVTNWKYKYAISDNVVYNFAILNDGSVLFQATEALPADAKEYDLYAEGEKYSVTTLLIDPETGKEKSIDTTFMFRAVYALDQFLFGNETFREYVGISDDYDNLASITYIEDKKLTNPVLTVLDNNAKVVCELFTDLPLIAEEELPEPFAKNIYYYETVNGTYIFINEKSEKIIEISTNPSDLERNENYIIIDKAIYDYSFRLVYDFGADNYELYSGNGWYYSDNAVTSDGILLTRDGAVYLYRNGATNLLISKGSDNNEIYDLIYSVSEHYFVIKKVEISGTKYVYYNASGDERFTSHGLYADCLMTNDDLGIALFRAYDVNGDAQYYRVTK